MTCPFRGDSWVIFVVGREEGRGTAEEIGFKSWDSRPAQPAVMRGRMQSGDLCYNRAHESGERRDRVSTYG